MVDKRVVIKFGGTSVQDAQSIQTVKEIIDNQTPTAVVVSAMSKVTDSLIQLGVTAAVGDSSYLEALEKLRDRHFVAIAELIPSNQLPAVSQSIEEIFYELSETLKGVLLVKELTTRVLDLIMSCGERLSATIIAASIPSARYVDARQLIQTDHSFGSALVNEEITNSNIQRYFKSFDGEIPIITGFIASTEDGQTSTLGRGGSDLTAAIFAAALKASELQIWTDVDGVMTADPRIVKQAFPIPNMTYNEMLEMSHLGAKVLHPPTVIPALKNEIPIRIKNTFNPQAEGTLIQRKSDSNGTAIRGLSSINRVALMQLEGSGMVGVCGVANRLFGALAAKNINVIMISQCSSEHSICFAVDVERSHDAKLAIEKEFALEMQVHHIDRIVIEENMCVIAAVGENMRHTTGVAGSLFSALGKNGINVHAIAQGSSEYNITCVVDKRNESKALNVIHEAFFLSSSQTLHAFLIGTGLIGATLLEQIQKQREHLIQEYGLEVKIVGLANSKRMLFNKEGIDLSQWSELLQESNQEMDLNQFVQNIHDMNLRNSCFVDCTASETIASVYEGLLRDNISVVTPNKKANSSSYEQYKSLNTLARKKGVKFLYETNVGAGLPILSTIRDLLRSGDRILQIEGILSGSLSYLFNNFGKEQKFSQIVRQAQKEGYTEPDPREDLNGMDVARKLLILARESGYALELDEIELTPFLPGDCFVEESIEEFYLRLEKQDQMMSDLERNAAKEGKVLRFVATLKDGQGKISLQALGPDHPFYHLSGSDNMLSFTTERYLRNPMVISGQGAGAEVTAGEVFADMIRVGRL